MIINTFLDIVESVRSSGRLRVIVPHPDTKDFKTVAAASEFISPVFVGDKKKITQALKGKKISVDSEIVECGRKDVMPTLQNIIKSGRGEILMQGSIPGSVFFKALLKKENGFIISRVASYASVFQLLKKDKLIIATDTFVQDSPSLVEKQAILENALKLSSAFGIACPKVALLAAIEQVNPSIQSTIDAAILAKMADRKQFGNIMAEGPLDIDCALDHKAAARKGVKSEITGNVDIYFVPDVETGYQLLQMLVYIGKMKTAGVILGMRVPVITNLPYTAETQKPVELAMAALLARRPENR